MKSDAGNPGRGKPGAGRPAAVAAALVCIAAAAGCASSSGSTATAPSSKAVTASSSRAPAAPGSTPAAAPSPTPTPPTAPSACRTSTLTVKLGLSQGYAGGVYQVLSFANASSAACTLYGYPGVSLVTGPPYVQVGPAAERDTAPVKLVTLAPGAAATAVLQVVDALNFPASTCSPVRATNLRVYPPNQAAPVYLADTAYGCTKPVQTLFISAVQANGEAHPMTNAGSDS
jgi:Protein of unknown function (DUF4232)